MELRLDIDVRACAAWVLVRQPKADKIPAGVHLYRDVHLGFYRRFKRQMRGLYLPDVGENLCIIQRVLPGRVQDHLEAVRSHKIVDLHLAVRAADQRGHAPADDLRVDGLHAHDFREDSLPSVCQRERFVRLDAVHPFPDGYAPCASLRVDFVL